LSHLAQKGGKTRCLTTAPYIIHDLQQLKRINIYFSTNWIVLRKSIVSQHEIAKDSS